MEFGENYADRNVKKADLLEAWKEAQQLCTIAGSPWPWLAAAAAHQGSIGFDDVLSLCNEAASASEDESTHHCQLLREILGNPFHQVTLDSSWLPSTVMHLANSIYQDRAFDRMPILADAMEDAGCDNAEILNHCRQPGVHVRGCWLVDLLLGKE